uniref:Beta-galactosidase galactose-binding domain-containing protein n=1 Tax=Hyaloperonospora arabidopsidis (strain Emoy2) TaxID=559515 RepID=M4BR92_HYAAE
MYADGVNLHFDGLSNEPKRSHLCNLHQSLIECNDILLRNDRQLLNPRNMSSSGDQRAFVYGSENGHGQVAFLENMANKRVTVEYGRSKYELRPFSMLIVKDGVVLFDTADVRKSFSGHQRRTYSPLVKPATLEWKTWSELNVSMETLRKRVVAMQPIEQLRLTADQSDYMTYETTFNLRQPHGLSVNTNDDAATLQVTSCEGNSIIAFVDGWLIGERSLAYPGGNCSKEFQFHMPMNVDVNHNHELKLVSVSLGIHSLESNHSKGITGSVRVGHADLTDAQEWRMYPCLIGEQLEIYRLQWSNSVPWTAVSRLSASSGDGVTSGRQLMSWYRTSFQYPLELHTTSEQQSSILLDLFGLTRGRAFINGHDLGRYWLINDEGDFVQRYYQVPQDWLLQDDKNLLVLFDELGGSVADVRLVSSAMVLADETEDNIAGH